MAHVLARGASASGPALLDAGRILFQDDDLIAVDKPAGVAAQGTEVDADGGLDAAVRALLLRGGTPAPFVGLVHRLDLETSGVTILARSQSALTALSRKFREGSVRKRYVALVSGVPSWQEKTVEGPIGADRHRRGAFTVSSHGRPASSAFTVLERHGNPGEIGAYAKVQVLPRTGRTHQIRVHASAMGHPLLGDRRYGGPDALTTAIGERVEVPRVALHAMELWCVHPNGTDLHLSAPWPADLSAFERRWAGTPTQTL